MCGIIGYSGPKEPLPILIGGLSRLEYRGYDSAGVAILDGKKLTIEKKEGKLQVLKDHLEDKKNYWKYWYWPYKMGNTRNSK
jgi:glucosamine--fructose-6-phosphate aminotransferase (isomerizing)